MVTHEFIRNELRFWKGLICGFVVGIVVGSGMFEDICVESYGNDGQSGELDSNHCSRIRCCFTGAQLRGHTHIHITHIHTHTHTNTHKHTHTHSFTHKHTKLRSLTHIHITHIITHSYTHTQTNTDTHTLTQTHTHITHIRLHTHRHTHRNTIQGGGIHILAYLSAYTNFASIKLKIPPILA